MIFWQSANFTQIGNFLTAKKNAVPVGRFKRVRSGSIDIRDAFLTAEDGFVYEVILPCDDSFDRVIAVSCQELNDEWLPVAGELLNFDSEPLPALLLQKQEVKWVWFYVEFTLKINFNLIHLNQLFFN